MFLASRTANRLLLFSRAHNLHHTLRHHGSLASCSLHPLQQLLNTSRREWRRRREHDDENGSKWRHHLPHSPLLAWTMLGLFGWEDWKKLDDDPLKDKVKWAKLHRRQGNFDQAVNVLHEALRDAEKLKNPKIVTRIYDELANTHYEADELDKADHLFRLVIHSFIPSRVMGFTKLITIHRKTESSPEFIGISLKLCDIFTRKGDPESADIGYKHCLAKQLQQVDKTLSIYHLEYGSSFEYKNVVDHAGIDYIEPFALLGMCLHEYALFLMDCYPDTRLDEASEYINEALKISYKIFGINAFHSMNILATFAAKCVLANKFETARKYLEIGLSRLLLLPECESVYEQNILLSYYCCYAEALFHTGAREEGVKYAQRAVELAKEHPDPAVREHCRKFARKMAADALRVGGQKEEEEEMNKEKAKKERRPWPF